ncbi:MAG: hypothetical protein AAGF91_03455 [Actinomycetota bacterium]
MIDQPPTSDERKAAVATLRLVIDSEGDPDRRLVFRPQSKNWRSVAALVDVAEGLYAFAAAIILNENDLSHDDVTPEQMAQVRNLVDQWVLEFSRERNADDMFGWVISPLDLDDPSTD